MVRLGSKATTGWKATVSVAMSNYIEAGSIIAIATSLGFWQAQFGLGNFAVGLLMIALLTLALVVGAVWAPRTQGRSLQEIEDERYSSSGTSEESLLLKRRG